MIQGRVMKLRRLTSLINNQRGFTLVELVLVIAISGVIGAGITGTVFQVFNGNLRTTSHMTVIREVQNAGYWVSRDSQMAQTSTVPAAPGFPFILIWTKWDSTEHEVTYSINADNELERSEKIDNGAPIISSIARYIDTANTSCIDTGGKLVFTITATIGTGSMAESETRVYEILPRPQ